MTILFGVEYPNKKNELSSRPGGVMGLRPIQADEKLHPRFFVLTEVSSRPERTRISCYAALDKTTCAPFRKEGRMKCTNATKFHRKSGGAQWRDLLFPPSPIATLQRRTALPFVIPTEA
jgi:hypothetical protein